MISKSRLLRLGMKLLVEIAIIATASVIVILGLRATGYLPSTPMVRREPRLSVGSHLTIKAVDFHDHPLSLVLITSPTCPYCLASKSFHRTLIAESHHGHVPFYVVVPSRPQAAGYTKDTGFSESSIKELRDLNLSPEGTPTIVAVDQNGVIKKVWLGRLSAARESDVLKTAQSQSISESASNALEEVTNYSPEDVKKLKGANKITIIETRERDAPGIRADAIIMPSIELPFRAPIELQKDHLQIVDCSNLVQARCESAVHALTKGGFRVATLNAGNFEETCEITKTQ